MEEFGIIDACTLVELRNSRRMSQRELADLLGVSQSMISFYESGKCIPNNSIYQKICDIFGVNEDEIEISSSLGKYHRLTLYDAELIGYAGKLPDYEKRLLLAIAQQMVRQCSER